jgi:hypothetical protein
MAEKVRTEQESSTSIPQAKLKLVPISQIGPRCHPQWGGDDIRFYVTRFAPSPTGYLQLGYYGDGGPLSVLLHASRDPGRDRARRGAPPAQSGPIRGHA